MLKSSEKPVSINLETKKLTYEQIEFAYEAALEAATKELFETFYSQHGWTKEEFIAASAIYAEAIQEGRLRQWVN